MDDQHDSSTEDQIRQLQLLHNQELITDAEYDAKRQAIIDRIGARPTEPPITVVPVPRAARDPRNAAKSPDEAAHDRQRKQQNPRRTTSTAINVGIAIVIVIAVVFFVASLGSGLGRDPNSAGDETTPNPTSRCTANVEYVINGTAKSVSITMENRQQNTEQIDEAFLPYSKSLWNLDCGTFVYISAQNLGEHGNVQCQIKANGVEIERAFSEGAHVIATCSGSAER